MSLMHPLPPVMAPQFTVNLHITKVCSSHCILMGTGMSYIVVMDYLTKWPEVFAVPDQSAATIAKLIVEEVISHQRVPSEILSDCGRSFRWRKWNSCSVWKGEYNCLLPSNHRLTERNNRTLKSMLAKIVEKGGKDWDDRIPDVLFACQA